MPVSKLSSNRIILLAAVGVVAAVALVALGVLVGQNLLAPLGDAASRLESQADTESPTPTPTPEPETVERDIGDFVEFEDEQGDFEILVPDDWEIRSVDDPQVRLLATPNGRDSVLVRFTALDFEDLDLEGEVTEEDLIDLHGFTEDIVRSDDDVEVLIGPQVVELAGTASSYYLYTFPDGDDEERGAHAHYFIFQDDTMISLVLQAVPEQRFVQLADTFDIIADSFELLR